MSAAAIVASQLMTARKRIVRQLLDLSAFDSPSAAPVNLKDGFDRQTMKTLLGRSIVFQPERGRFYLDRDALSAYEASESRQVIWTLVVLAVIFAVVIAVAWLRR